MEELRSTDPALVGGYRLVARLGHGGMGRVYLATSPGGRKVALKVIRDDLAEDTDFRERFRREIAAARKVAGVFTAAVVDADIDASPAWLATAYVQGPSLGASVEQDGPLKVADVKMLAAGLAEALQAIHRAGVIHRDLSPSNILLADDGPVVIDFGIARAVEDSHLTHTGISMGRPGYMSPEQALGREIGPSSDVFALGAVLYYASTGRHPYGQGSAPQLLYRVVHDRPDFDEVPDDLRDIVVWCMEPLEVHRPTPALLLDSLVPAGEPVVEVVKDGWTPVYGDGSYSLRMLTRPIFARRWVTRGYDTEQVDRFVERIMTAAGHGASRADRHPAPGASISAEEINGVSFRVRFGGYDEWQVDTWLELAEATFREVRRLP